MDYYTYALLLIVCSSIYIYMKKNLQYFEKLGIPHLSGWRILGILTDPILQKKHVSEVMKELYDLSSDAKYVGAFVLTKPVFVLRDLELIKSVTIRNFDYFPDHAPIGDPKLDPLFFGTLFSMVGQNWKDTRSVLSPAFTSSKIKIMFELMLECAKSFVDFIDEQSSETLKMVGTKDFFTRYIADVTATCAFGIKIDSLREPKNEFFVIGMDTATMDAKKSLKMMLTRLFPAVKRALGIKLFTKKIEDFFTNLVSTTVKMRDEKGITRPDMLQLIMDLRGQDTKSAKLDNACMTSQGFTFIFAGFDPTASSLCVVAHELALNPDAQKTLLEEVDKVMEETNGQPTYEAIQGMRYLDAAFHEAQRMHPQASFLDRVCKEAFDLPACLPGCNPVTIQPGSLIWIPVAAIHRDPKYYDNPNKFDPGRYYGKKISHSDPTTLAFGIGPRYCIGNRMAILLSKILLVHLLAKYSFVANEKTCNPLTYSKKSLTVQANGGYWLALKARK